MNKNIRIVYGLGREDMIFSRLKHSILGIERSKYKYSFFDFYQKSSNVLFELKSLGYAKTGLTKNHITCITIFTIIKENIM